MLHEEFCRGIDFLHFWVEKHLICFLPHFACLPARVRDICSTYLVTCVTFWVLHIAQVPHIAICSTLSGAYAIIVTPLLVVANFKCWLSQVPQMAVCSTLNSAYAIILTPSLIVVESVSWKCGFGLHLTLSCI